MNATVMMKNLPPRLRGLLLARSHSGALGVLSSRNNNRVVSAIAAGSSEDEGSGLLRRTRTEDGRRLPTGGIDIRQPLLEQDGLEEANGHASPQSL